MQNIIKRLELIKVAITLEESSIIATQIELLQLVTLPEQVQEIIKHLTALDYSLALQMITQFINDQTQLMPYEDTELTALKMELHGLELQIATLNAEKDEYICSVGQFNAVYSQRLGAKINELLLLRLQLAQFLLDKLEKENDSLDEQSPEQQEEQQQAEQQYQDAQSDFDSFTEDFAEQQQNLR